MSDFADLVSDALDAFAIFREGITYARGIDSATVQAEWAEVDGAMEVQDGLFVQQRSTRFVIVKAALVVGSATLTPAEGDVITAGGAEYHYLSHDDVTERLEWEVTCKKVV